MKNDKPRIIAVLLSLMVHGLVAVLLWASPYLSVRDQIRRQTTVEVELLNAEEVVQAMRAQNEIDRTKGQIVEQDEKALNEEVPEDAKFFSKNNQKVVRETQAPVIGKFNNSDATGGEKKAESKAGKLSEEKAGEQREETQQSELIDSNKALTAESGVASSSVKPSLKDLTPSFRPGPPRIEAEDLAAGGGMGPSATDDHLKNVPTGMQTLLSTREFVYYSYYNRIKDKLRQYWEPKIKEKMERIVRQGRQVASAQDRITRIIIILNQEGTLIRVQVIGPSGVQDLDDAAVEAFRAAAPFPNPPEGIVEPDGTIKIRWDFILEANAGGLMKAMRLAYKKD